MRYRSRLALALLVGCSWLGLAVAAESTRPAPSQDPKVLRFVERAVPYYPGSSFRVVEDEVRHTPSGSYRLLSVERSCTSQLLTGTTNVVVDEVTSEAWVGSRGILPSGEPGFDPRNLRVYLERVLPDLLKESLGMKVRVEWDGATRAGGLVRFVLRVDSGYGEYQTPGEFRKPAAVTADGKLLMLGAPYPFDQDPVEVRRDLLLGSPVVAWDHGAPAAAVQLVEMSDFECPGCKAKWPLVKKVLDAHGNSVRHGFVAFPLTTIHPWAFRAACGGWCVAAQKVELLLPLKELFYSLQRDMEVAEVTPTVRDFVAAHELDQAGFDACYLRSPSLTGVHDQMSLGHRLGVTATPTYFLNGWMIQVPEEGWFMSMVERLAAGQEP